ncbi:MAG: alpha/beta hydrolase [Thermodesulfobacteriota bacterium]|nr:alpha/beta hydrolase [Thermodesulfobacteriota bacterium]
MRGKPVLEIILGVLLLYVAYCCLLFLFQRQVVFPRHHIGAPLGMAKGIPGLERILLKTSYGKVEAWFLPATTNPGGGPTPAVIFAHGNGELIDFWPHEFGPATALGLGVLLVEYPGYGRSEGSPSQRSITEAFVAAYDTLAAREDVDRSRIVLLGRSLGGGAVCCLAARRPSAGLMLLSTFTSVRACASQFLVPRFLVLDPFDNLAVVGSYAGPVLVMHGKRDTLIPYRHGVALLEAAKDGTMLSYDCQHNDCPPNWHGFWKDATPFLRHAGIIEP